MSKEKHVDNICDGVAATINIELLFY